LSLTDDPWQSTLRLFSGTGSPVQAREFVAVTPPARLVLEWPAAAPMRI
jgi:hypothetical protein